MQCNVESRSKINIFKDLTYNSLLSQALDADTSNVQIADKTLGFSIIDFSFHQLLKQEAQISSLYVILEMQTSTIRKIRGQTDPYDTSNCSRSLTIGIITSQAIETTIKLVFKHIPGFS